MAESLKTLISENLIKFKGFLTSLKVVQENVELMAELKALVEMNGKEWWMICKLRKYYNDYKKLGIDVLLRGSAEIFKIPAEKLDGVIYKYKDKEGKEVEIEAKEMFIRYAVFFMDCIEEASEAAITQAISEEVQRKVKQASSLDCTDLYKEGQSNGATQTVGKPVDKESALSQYLENEKILRLKKEPSQNRVHDDLSATHQELVARHSKPRLSRDQESSLQNYEDHTSLSNRHPPDQNQPTPSLSSYLESRFHPEEEEEEELVKPKKKRKTNVPNPDQTLKKQVDLLPHPVVDRPHHPLPSEGEQIQVEFRDDAYLAAQRKL